MFSNKTENEPQMKWDEDVVGTKTSTSKYDYEPVAVDNPMCGSTDTVDNENVRLILIQLAEAGEIPQSVKYIEKANSKVVRKIYAKYQMKEQEKNNAVLTDVLITKFSELMGLLNTVPSGELLAAELREDKLLQRDIKKVVGFIAPFIPFIGVITGGATLGKHVMQHQRESDVKMGTDQGEPSEQKE